MCVTCSQYPLGLAFIYVILQNSTCTSQKTYLLHGPWVNVFKKMITVFQDNHAKPQNAFYANTQDFTC